MTAAREPRLVLDTSAVVAWLRGSLAVGEILAEVDDEGGAVLVPLWCLVEAGSASGGLGGERLGLLLAHPATFLITDDGDDWESLVAMRSLVGRHDCAAAAMQSVELQVDVMTGDPSWYEEIAGGRYVLTIED